MPRKLVVLTAFAVVFVFEARSASAGTPTITVPALPPETAPLAIITTLLTGIDLTLLDVAVTDADLADAGCDDTVPSMIDNPSLLIVDDDRMQCPNAQFMHIQDAVDAALPGAIIRVCPGLYNESVHITKPNLTLQAPRQQGQATECQQAEAIDPTQEAIVNFPGTFGFVIDFPHPSPSLQTRSSKGSQSSQILRALGSRSGSSPRRILRVTTSGTTCCRRTASEEQQGEPASGSSSSITRAVEPRS